MPPLSRVFTVVFHLEFRRATWAWLLMVTFSIGAAAEQSSEAKGGTVGMLPPTPVPAWFDSATWSIPASAPPARVPVEVLLSDAQDRLTAQGSDYYFRNVFRLLNAEGVRLCAEQFVVYAPEYQRISWHTLAITRGKEVLDRLPAAQFKQLQREPDLESQIISGRTTLVTVLDDIRVGDILEVAYTVHDVDPLLQGHMSARHYLGSPYPISRERIIVRTPGTGIKIKPSGLVPSGTLGLPDALFRSSALRLGIEEETVGDERVFRWENTGLAALQFDERISASAAPYYPMLQFTTFRTWSDVVDWAEPLFSKDVDLPETMRALVKQWKTQPDPGSQLSAAVGWVQNEIRYFAMAIGPHNLKPRALTEVCSSRFGDCKDKAMLLATLLRQLSFEAWPVLVNTQWCGKVREVAPSPFAFNHAIVAYRFKGQMCWIDPTIKGQRGDAGIWSLPPYEAGLVLRKNETDISAITKPLKNEPDTVTREVFTIEQTSGDAMVAVDVTLRGLEADFYRQQLETVSAAQMSRHWLNFIGRFYKQIEEVDPPAVNDDGVSQSLVIRSRYRIPNFVQTDKGETQVSAYAYGLRALIDAPTSRRRHWPYAMPQDRFVRHRIELELPFDAPPEQHPEAIITDGVEYRVEKGVFGRRFVAEHDLRVTADSVPAENMGRFCDAVDEILTTLMTTLRRPLAKKPADGTTAGERNASTEKPKNR